MDDRDKAEAVAREEARKFIDKILGRHGWKFEGVGAAPGMTMVYRIKRIADGRVATIERGMEELVVESPLDKIAAEAGLDAPVSITLCGLLLIKAKDENQKHPVMP